MWSSKLYLSVIWININKLGRDNKRDYIIQYEHSAVKQKD